MIVITTPTGQVGSQLLTLLDDADDDVRVVARDPCKLDAERFEVVAGGHDDPKVIDRALDGADALFWLVPPNPQADDVHEHYRSFTRPACEAIERHGVERVVAVSSLGRDHPYDAGLLTAAFEMEALLEQTGAHIRTLRMPYYMENLLAQTAALEQGTLTFANDPDRPLATCATRDIAAAAAGLLRDRTWTGRDAVSVVGPDDLTPRGIAEVIADVLGRVVELAHVPIEAFAASLAEHGFSDGAAQAFAAMIRAQDAGIYDAEVTAAQRSPTSLRTWAEVALKPA